MKVRCAACATCFENSTAVAFRKDGFEIVRCPNCSLLFRTQLPDAAELERIYDKSYFSSAAGDTKGQGYANYLAEEEIHRETARRRLAVLGRHIETGRLLDVGAAAGFFVDEAARSGWKARGVDVARPMVEWGRARLSASLDCATFQSIDARPASVDALTMWDYIEHSLDAAGDIAKAAELVRAGGIVALSTGDAESLVARLCGSRWHLLTPRHHNYFFSVPTLRRLLDRAGFEVVSVGHPGARYSVRYLVYKLRTVADVAPLRAVDRLVEGSALGRMAVPVNLGDIVTLHARRR